MACASVKQTSYAQNNRKPIVALKFTNQLDVKLMHAKIPSAHMILSVVTIIGTVYV